MPLPSPTDISGAGAPWDTSHATWAVVGVAIAQLVVSIVSAIAVYITFDIQRHLINPPPFAVSG